MKNLRTLIKKILKESFVDSNGNLNLDMGDEFSKYEDFIFKVFKTPSDWSHLKEKGLNVSVDFSNIKDSNPTMLYFSETFPEEFELLKDLIFEDKEDQPLGLFFFRRQKIEDVVELLKKLGFNAVKERPY